METNEMKKILFVRSFTNEAAHPYRDHLVYTEVATGATLRYNQSIRIAVYVNYGEINVRVGATDTTEVYQQYIVDGPREVLVDLLNSIIRHLP